MQNTKTANYTQLPAVAWKKQKNFKTGFIFKKAYGSYDELLEDPEVEAVYIPLPNHLHKEWVLKAAAHKKHILCEKPMSGSAKDTKMIQACKDAGVILMEAFAYLHSPLMQELKLQIDQGLIGDVNFIESTFYTPGYEDNIRIHRDTLGGSLYDLGCYNITFASYLLGKAPMSAKAFLILQRNISMMSPADIFSILTIKKQSSLARCFHISGRPFFYLRYKRNFRSAGFFQCTGNRNGI